MHDINIKICLFFNTTGRMSQLLKLTQRQRSKMDFVHFASYEREVE